MKAVGTLGFNFHKVSDRKFRKALEYLILKGFKSVQTNPADEGL